MVHSKERRESQKEFWDEHGIRRCGAEINLIKLSLGKKKHIKVELN